MTNKYIEDGCPSGMYPFDSKYSNEEDNLDDLITGAESASDSLNYPISWYLTKDDKFGEKDKFEVVFVMGRKYGDTWSLYTHDFDADKAVAWVKDFTKREATIWYGWDE